MSTPTNGRKTIISIYAKDLLGFLFSLKMVIIIPAYISVRGIQYHRKIKSDISCQLIMLLPRNTV